MKSIMKLSLFAAALAFAAPNLASAATSAPKQHNVVQHKGKKVKAGKGHYRHHQKNEGDKTTADLNARSLRVIQSENGGQGNVAPQAPGMNNHQGNVVVAPGTGNTVAPPAAPAGAVNPNNMPPAQ